MSPTATPVINRMRKATTHDGDESPVTPELHQYTAGLLKKVIGNKENEVLALTSPPQTPIIGGNYGAKSKAAASTKQTTANSKRSSYAIGWDGSISFIAFLAKVQT